MTKRVLVLGGSGMLGSMVVDVLKDEFEVIATTRSHIQDCIELQPDVEWHHLTVGVFFDDKLTDYSHLVEGTDYIINCIGVIKSQITSNPVPAIFTNALFPHQLAARCGSPHIIQIATDCVFSGEKVDYSLYEDTEHDARDVYGRTKSLGEITDDDHITLLRCSIVGPEPFTNRSLLEWFLSQSAGDAVNGFKNHFWNGITTLAFARICAGIMRSDFRISTPLQHIEPAYYTSKWELLEMFKTHFRPDITIKSVDAAKSVHRVLGTLYPEQNEKLWGHAGYIGVPSITALVAELADYMQKECID